MSPLDATPARSPAPPVPVAATWRVRGKAFDVSRRALVAPENEVGIASPHSFDELRSSFGSPGAGRIAVVAADDPELGPYSRYRTVDASSVEERCAAGWRTLTPREVARATTPPTSEAP
jgi:hypothetical protein